MTTLFEAGGSGAHGQGYLGKKRKSMAYTEAQRLSATLNAKKAEVLTGDKVEVNLDRATLTTEGSTYLLPVAFVEKLRSGMAKRQGASPQDLLEPIDGPLEEKALNWDNDTRPIYWLYMPLDDGSTEAWPVYGYAADYGMGYHVTPFLGSTELSGWDDCEWLCRCAQCGRELPPSYFFLNTSGRLKGICRGCTSTNRTVDKIFNKPMRYRSDEELQLLVDTRHWYEALWRRNLCPRGGYASWCIGEADIQERMRIATRHKRGSAPRRPPNTNQSKITAINQLISETLEV